MGSNEGIETRRHEDTKRLSNSEKLFVTSWFNFVFELMRSNYAHPNWLPDVHASRFHQDPGGSRQDAREGEEDRLRRRANVRPRADRCEGTGEDPARPGIDLRRDARPGGSNARGAAE